MAHEHDEMTQYFLFLDGLRIAAKINMWGAAPYLCEHFSLDKRKAAEIHSKWMRTFNNVQTAAERAAQVMP